MELKNSVSIMKKIVLLLMLVLSLIISAQSIEKKCKTCGKVLSVCSFHGRHPNKPQKSNANKPNNRIGSNKPQEPEPYIERTETKQPGEEYEIKGKFGSSGLALVKLRGKYGFINKEGDEIIPLKYDNVYCDHSSSDLAKFGWYKSHSLMSVSQNGKWGYVNQKGELIIPMIYSRVKEVVSEGDISIVCKKDGKWGAIGQDASIHIPFIYDEIEHFYNNRPSYALLDGKFGYIDAFNNTIAPFKYSNARGFPLDGSLAAVGNKGNYGYIDLHGQEVIPLKYEMAGTFYFYDVGDLEKAIAGVVLNKKLGFINGKGELVIPCQYEYETKGNYNHIDISGGFYGVTGLVKKNGKLGVINRKGDVVVPFVYDRWSSRSSNGNINLVKDDQTFYFDKGGNLYSTEKERDDSSTIRLARQGFPNEQAWIGCYYYKGNNGYPKDYQRALYWFNRAASQNNGHALEHLGDMSYYGKGVAKNYKDAFAYYYKSAELGNSGAMYSLGWMYEHGQGVGKDVGKAREYYKKSADKGNEEAKKKLQELSSTTL